MLLYPCIYRSKESYEAVVSMIHEYKVQNWQYYNPGKEANVSVQIIQ
jgi:hypothetical protein